MIHRLATVLAALLFLAMPAEAHRLKLFAQVTGASITGYGFYIGGGRPRGADMVIATPDGKEVALIKTGDDGGFSFTPPSPGRFHLKLVAGDGHFAELDISTDGTPAITPSVTVGQAAAPIPADLEDHIAQTVDAAVARQIRPLLEAYDDAEGRVRFNDLIGGLGWIMGLAGLWAWFRSRRSGHGD